MLETMLCRAREALNRVGLDAHWINEDREPGDRFGEPSGKLWRHGRLWIRRNDHHDYSTLVGFEWVVRMRMPGFSISSDASEGEMVVRFEGPVGTIFTSFGVGHDLAGKISKIAGSPYGHIDIISATFHHNTFWWRLMQDTDTWASKDPWWRRSNVGFEDLLLGETKVSDRWIGPEQIVDIGMPEGFYRWKVRMKQRTVARRWSKEVFTVADMEALPGQHLPQPGKGESSWDCGPDGIHALHTPARNVGDAVGKLVGRVLQTRLNRGGDPAYAADGIHDKQKAS